VTRISFFGERVAGEAQKELETATREHLLKRGEVLYRADDHPTGLHFIQFGLIGLIASGTSGNEYLIRLSKTGQYIGHRSLFAGEAYHATAIALENTKVISVSKVALFRVMEKFPSVSFLILETIAKELKLSELGRVALAEKGVAARVAESIIYLQERFPEHQWTRREIAEFCSSTTSTVIRTLGRFQDSGLIRQTGRKIEILDKEGLLDLAS
jgi:CRP-like cAMP-binding protein